MKLNQFHKVIGILAVFFLGLLSGCASTPSQPVKAAPVASAAPDQSEPSSPIVAAVIEAPKPAPVKPKEPPKPGSVASVLKKMETSPYTLYWKESDSYSYFVGGLLDAEYKPGDGLTVQAIKGDDSGIICQYSEQGKLDAEKAGNNPKSEEACTQLMFTLDDELSD